LGIKKQWRGDSPAVKISARTGHFIYKILLFHNSYLSMSLSLGLEILYVERYPLINQKWIHRYCLFVVTFNGKIDKKQNASTIFHFHHVVPKSFPFKLDVLVKLSVRAHVLAHLMLYWAFLGTGYSDELHKCLASLALTSVSKYLPNRYVDRSRKYFSMLNKSIKGRRSSSETMKNTWRMGHFDHVLATQNRTKGHIWVCNKEIQHNTTIDPNSEGFSVLISLGYEKGRLDFSDETRLRMSVSHFGVEVQSGRIRIYNPKTLENRRVYPSVLNDFLDAGWIKGQARTKGEEYYLNKKRQGDHTVVRIRNKNTGEIKRIQKKYLYKYSEDTWKFGSKAFK
jgi:hypothetical protein